MSREARWEALTFVLGFAMIFFLSVWLSAPREPRVSETTARELARKPRHLWGREVVLPTAGLQPDGNRLVYRRLASDPPACVLEFPGGLPQPLPAKVRGFADWNAAGPAVVSDCRAHP